MLVADHGPSRRFRAGIRSAAVSILATALAAQTAPIPGHWTHLRLRSGVHSNPSPVDGVVHREFVTLPAATPWLRVYFSRAQLGKGSYLRIVSLADGDVMTMRQEHLEQWGNSTAYFNGNAVMIELVAGPKTDKNFFAIDKVMAGDLVQEAQPDSICGAADNRLPALDTRIGRIVPNGCTGWIINRPAAGTDKCHLSAGHCTPGGQVLQFGVPTSQQNCGLRHPPATRQFMIDVANAQSAAVPGGPGADWWVFRCFPNPTSGLTTFQTQGGAFNLATAMPAVGSTVRVTGYGRDGTNTNNAPGANASCVCAPANNTGTRHQTLQSLLGPVTGFPTVVVNHQVDTCGGNSGSPIINVSTAAAIGIHTHGGCGNPVGATANGGQQITTPALQAAITAVCQGPALHGNSECAQALSVTNGSNGPYNNANASSSAPVWPCGIGVAKDCWFRYVATCTGNTVFDTCSANLSVDSVMQVFDGCGGASLGCNDDIGATCAASQLASRVVVNTTAGAEYLIRVGGTLGSTVTFDLNVTPCGTADECADAIPLQIGVNGPFSSAAATTSAPAWPCANGGNDLWFHYTVTCPNTTTLTLSTCDGANFDTAIEAFSGSCNSLTSLGCNDDTFGACGNRSTLAVPAAHAETIHVRVGGFNAGAGTFLLRVKEDQPNDDCNGAIALQVGTNGPFCNLSADDSVPQWPCGTTPNSSPGSDLWFSYQPGHTGNLEVSTCTATRNFDTVLEVFSGSCGAPVSVGCNDDGGGGCGLGSSVTVPVTSGQTYLIRVGGHSGTQGNFDVVVTGAVGNDDCSAATAVVLGTNGPYTNTDSTTSAPAWNCGLAACDVWFRYTAGCTGAHTFSTCTATRTFDTVLEVFDGSCLAPNLLGCDDDTCATGSKLSVNLQNGQTAWIRVGGHLGATGNFDLVVDTGAGTGTVSALPHACGITTIAAAGSPNVGGHVTISLGNVTATPFIGLGLVQQNAPFCGACTIGPVWAAASIGTSYTLQIPCDTAFIGLVVFAQGADFKALTGCPSPPMTLTDTLVITIG